MDILHSDTQSDERTGLPRTKHKIIIPIGHVDCPVVPLSAPDAGSAKIGQYYRGPHITSTFMAPGQLFILVFILFPFSVYGLGNIPIHGVFLGFSTRSAFEFDP